MTSCTIIIITRNRANSLASTLAALANIEVPEWLQADVLVVDNGSTDATPEVVANCGLSHLPIRYIKETRKGKSYALNSALTASKSEILLFLDDDVVPPRQLLAGMCTPIISGRADAIAGGVRLAPHLNRPWMSKVHRAMLAETGHLDEEHPKEMIGANMAIGRHVLRRVPAFDTELGPGALGFGEDTLFAFQLTEAGFQVRGAFDVVVEHHPDPERLSRKSLLRAARVGGKVWSYIQYHWLHESIGRKPIYLVKSSLRLLIRRCLTLHQRQPEGAPEWELQNCMDIWVIFYFLRRAIMRKRRNYALKGLIKKDAANCPRNLHAISAAPIDGV